MTALSQCVILTVQDERYTPITSDGDRPIIPPKQKGKHHHSGCSLWANTSIQDFQVKKKTAQAKATRESEMAKRRVWV